jgi:hypothetical protein
MELFKKTDKQLQTFSEESKRALAKRFVGEGPMTVGSSSTASCVAGCTIFQSSLLAFLLQALGLGLGFRVRV